MKMCFYSIQLKMRPYLQYVNVKLWLLSFIPVDCQHCSFPGQCSKVSSYIPRGVLGDAFIVKLWAQGQVTTQHSQYSTAIHNEHFNFCDSSRCRILMLSKRQIFMPEIVSDIHVLVCALYKLFIIICNKD